MSADIQPDRPSAKAAFLDDSIEVIHINKLNGRQSQSRISTSKINIIS